MADEDDRRRNVFEPLPIDRLVGAPLDAMIEAQINASRRYRNFIEEECLEKSGDDDESLRAKMIGFDFPEPVVDGEGTVVAVRRRSIEIPLLATVSHPILAIQEGRVEFEMEVTEARRVEDGDAQTGRHSRTSIRGVVTHRGEQTRSTDTRARYSFSTSLKREDPPEALMRVIDYLTDAATRPTLKETRQRSDERAAGDRPADAGS